MGKVAYGVMVAAIVLLAVFSLYQLNQNSTLKSQLSVAQEEIRLLEENITNSRIIIDYYINYLKNYTAQYSNLTLNSRIFNYTIEVSTDTYAKPIGGILYFETTDVALLNVQLVPVNEVCKTNTVPSPDVSLEPRYLPIINEQGQAYFILQTDAYNYDFYNLGAVQTSSTVVIGGVTHYITNYTYSGAMDIAYYNVLNSTTFKVVGTNGWPLAKFYVALPP